MDVLIVAALMWLVWFLVTLVLVVIIGVIIGAVIGVSDSLAMKVYYKGTRLIKCGNMRLFGVKSEPTERLVEVSYS